MAIKLLSLYDWVYQLVSLSVCHTNDEWWLHSGDPQSDQSLWLHSGGAHMLEKPNWIKIDNQRESSQHIYVCLSWLRWSLNWATEVSIFWKITKMDWTQIDRQREASLIFLCVCMCASVSSSTLYRNVIGFLEGYTITVWVRLFLHIRLFNTVLYTLYERKNGNTWQLPT